jgi:hypothetical protein
MAHAMAPRWIKTRAHRVACGRNFHVGRLVAGNHFYDDVIRFILIGSVREYE